MSTKRGDLDVLGALSRRGNNVVTVDQLASAVFGVGVGGLVARSTNGGVPRQVENATNLQNFYVLDFANDATVRSADLLVPMPPDWNGGTFTMNFIWMTTATSGDVVWQASARSYGDAETMDQANGTAVATTDTASGTGSQRLKSATSGAITAAGTPAAGESLLVRVFRDAAHASDNLAATASLISVVVNYTRTIT